MPGRKPLFNAELQTDLDGKSFNIRNLNQIDVIQTGMVYVDPNLPSEIGKIDSQMAFKTLDAALRSAPAGYNIVLRPGTHSYDGILEVKRSRIKILGTGAVIVPTTANGMAGLKIIGSFVTVDGIIFDGGRTGSPSNIGTVIEVNRAANVSLINLVIRAQQGDAITLADDYSSTLINNCSITDCKNGIVASILTNHDINDVTISDNTIQNIRSAGIDLVGNANVNRLGDIKITGNDIVNVDIDGTASASIGIRGGGTQIIIANNYISRGFYGIFCAKCQDVVVSNNSLAGYNGLLIYFDGCRSCTVSNNLLDGANPTTGAPQAPVGIQLVGTYSNVLNDTGPFTISSNMISGIVNNGKFFNIANANDITISSNQMTSGAYLQAISFQNLKITGNIITNTSNNPTIVLNAAERGWIGCVISDNKFQSTGTQGRLISTTDSVATGQKNITIVGNLSTEGKTYLQGIYSNVSGAAPGNAFLHSNSPPSIVRTGGEYDNRSGWVNDYQANFEASHINIPVDSTAKYKVGGIQVVGTRITGWALPTGTQTRTTFDPATVTLAVLAQHVNALLHDLHIDTGHGLIGTVPAGTPGYS